MKKGVQSDYEEWGAAEILDWLSKDSKTPAILNRAQRAQ